MIGVSAPNETVRPCGRGTPADHNSMASPSSRNCSTLGAITSRQPAPSNHDPGSSVGVSRSLEIATGRIRRSSDREHPFAFLSATHIERGARSSRPGAAICFRDRDVLRRNVQDRELEPHDVERVVLERSIRGVAVLESDRVGLSQATGKACRCPAMLRNQINADDSTTVHGSRDPCRTTEPTPEIGVEDLSIDAEEASRVTTPNSCNTERQCSESGAVTSGMPSGSERP